MIGLILTVIVIILLAKFVFHVTGTVLGFLFNSLVGAIILWVLNLFGLGITINWLTAALVGFLGIPGVVIVLILKFVFHLV